MAASVPRQFITLNSLKIGEAVAGDGEPILFLHGWGASIDLVWPLAAGLADDGYRVYALDLPGFGQSDEPPQAWSVFDYAKFVITYLDHHQLTQVRLFGHSFGGRLGLILGAEHPERIQQMVLAGSAGVVTPLPLMTRVRLSIYKGIRDWLYKVGAKSTADKLRAWYGQRYGSSDYKDVSGVMRATMVKVVNQDLRDYAARVSAPTLLLWGDQDDATPLWQGQMLEQMMPDAGLVIYEGAGHYSYLDRLHDARRVMAYFFAN